MSESESVRRLEDLLGRLENARTELEESHDAERVIDVLGELAELAKEVQAEIDRARTEGRDAVS